MDRKGEGMGYVSRRSFLQGAVAAAAGAALTGAAAGVVGCTPAAQGTSDAPGEPTATAAARTPVCHECDALVLGGGIAGMEAALHVVEQGKTAIIVDKGVFGHSGTSGMNWGHTYQSMEYSEPNPEEVASVLATMDMVCEGLLDQEYFMNVLMATFEEKPIQHALKYGSYPLYTEDGVVLSQNGEHFNIGFAIAADQGFWPRMMAQWCKRDGNVTKIVENTFVLDILLDESGAAAGAVAVNLIDGTPVVFRAKSVIWALGNQCWVCGWNGMGAESMAGKENTGDGNAMLLRLGVPMADMEQYCGSAGQWYPKGIRQTMGGLNFDGGETPKEMCFDANMVNFNDIMAANEIPGLFGMGRQTVFQYSLRANGRATEAGGFLMDKDEGPLAPRYDRRTEERQRKTTLRYEMPQYLEQVPMTWDSAGHPRDLNATSETVIPGLFYAGAAPGGLGGMTQIASMSGGWMSANGAVERADAVEMPKLDEEKVRAAFEKAYGRLAQGEEGALRPREVMRKIQLTYWPRETGAARDEAQLNDIIKEVGRILEEDIPAMRCADQSLRMNTEWRDALEAENMALCVLASCHAALQRKETRGYHVRTDYPDLDPVGGLANTVTTLNADGSWASEMQPKKDSVVPKETLAEMIVPFGLSATAK